MNENKSEQVLMNVKKRVILIACIVSFAIYNMSDAYAYQSMALLFTLMLFFAIEKTINVQSWKVSLKKSVQMFFVFCGFLLMFTSFIQPVIILPFIKPTVFEQTSIKFNSVKLLDLKGMELFLDKDKKMVNVFYENGAFKKNIVDKVNLIKSSDSELTLKHSEFYEINSHIDVAFPLYHSETVLDYLFRIELDNEYYVFSVYVPQKYMTRLFNSIAKEELLTIEKDNYDLSFYLLNDEEIVISNGFVYYVSKYQSIDYSKDDFFLKRYESFKENDTDNTIVSKDITINLYNTIANPSDTVDRISFYTENNSVRTLFNMLEIIIGDKSYVFRTKKMN